MKLNFDFKYQIMIPSKQFSYTLHKLSFLLDKIADRALQKKLGISFSQFRILIAINRGEKVCQKDVAGFWDMTQAAVCRQIDLLRDKKLMQSTQNAKNRRENILTLTAFGKKQLKRAYEIVDSAYEEIYKVIENNEREVLDKSIRKLLDVVSAGGQDFSCRPDIEN